MRSPPHDTVGTPPILDHKHPTSPSVFEPAALLREARRQKGITNGEVPPVCILDPDGDIVRWMRQSGRAQPFAEWPCYHTELDTFSLAGQTVGIVGRVVGASFATLVAEELFASGCRLLVSLTSAGQITPAGTPKIAGIRWRKARDAIRLPSAVIIGLSTTLNPPTPIRFISEKASSNSFGARTSKM